jgi:proline dehydrogenase
MVRALLLFLSRQKQLRHWMETSATARRLASRFVAGETLEQALSLSRSLNAEGISVTLDHLGESVNSLDEAAAARDVYVRTLEAIHSGEINGNVSLKLTQFGLDLAEPQCLANVERLVKLAASFGNFVRVDMESTAYTGRTIGIVTALHGRYGAVGTVIQAYLYRSKADVEHLNALGIRVRLCKGAYLEPATVAFPSKEEVDRNYVELMKLLLDRGTYPAIATHDEKMIDATKAYASNRNIPRESFEFQMLYGIRRDLQRKLIADGYHLRLYVPFGKAWYPYYMRRMAERPANVLFILRNLFRD